VSGEARYALYYIPPPTNTLYRLGMSLLGYDCYTGADVAHPDDAGLPSDWASLTAAPRRYGFHGTLKAPFRLAAGFEESAAIAAIDEFCRAVPDVPTIEPYVSALGDFIAIVPRIEMSALRRLAADCVREFERFRAPPSPAERARRLASPLSERERDNFERWGYPYVFEDFRFHMTLTGPLGGRRLDSQRELLSRYFERRHGNGAIAIDRVALVRQDHGEARFRVLHVAIFGDSEAPRASLEHSAGETR
jgi:putative phosphonate metabolism protein